ncbi:hypothetical protein V8E53_011812 [Lactarius tabidus]
MNKPSTIIAETEFKLMGDIMELKMIPIPTDDIISYSKIPSVVVVHGSVTFVDKANDYFVSHIHGRLLSFEPNMEPGTGNSLCTKVSVDTISLLSEIIDSPQSKKPGDIYNVVDDEGAVVLKDCVHKYVDKPGNKPSVQLATDKMSLIGCSKGKHKVGGKLNKFLPKSLYLYYKNNNDPSPDHSLVRRLRVLEFGKDGSIDVSRHASLLAKTKAKT